MALIRSLNTAVGGLRAQQFRIEVIGNNIANVDTTAFKSSRAEFSTLLSQNLTYGVAPQGFLGGIDPVQIGLGTQIAATSTDFSQGPTEATGVNTDVAIQGDGMFVLTDAAGGQVYSRDGSFTINPASLLHDPATGFVVQGWLADNNFQVTPGGPLQDIELQVGLQTIARATDRSVLGGNLNSAGNVASQGTLLLSDTFYDSRFNDSDLITSDNPVGLRRADATTPLANLVRSLGDFTAHGSSSLGTPATTALVFNEFQTQLSGFGITVDASKGLADLPSRTFVVGDPPPTGGTTLGDFMEFLQGTLGVNDGVWDGAEQGQHMVSYARTNPVISAEEIDGTISLATTAGGADDSASLSSLVDHQANFRGVMTGDIVRFRSGASAGQFAEVVGVSASTPGGTLDTLTFRTDGFNALSLVPATGDTYTVHASAGIRLAEDVSLLNVDSSAATTTVGSVSTSGSIASFVVTDTAISNLALQHGVGPGQLVQYQSGGTTVQGRISSSTANSFTVVSDASVAQPPDAGTTFSIIDEANGSLEVAGNVGSRNALDNIQIVSAGESVAMFGNPPVVEAAGESTTTLMTVFDSLGTPRQVKLTFVYEGSSSNGPNTWRYFAESADDTDENRIAGTGTVLFSDTGQFLTTGEPSSLVIVDLDSTPESGGGVNTPFTFDLDFTRLTQFATTSSEVDQRDQDGFEAGTLREFSIGNDGTIAGIFSNGLSRVLGQIPVARFANPNGLQQQGNNMFKASTNSGIPNIGVAGTFGRGTLQSGVLEESNVDLAAQFTDMIVGQRAFQANARTITVSDEMLQELVNLV